MVKPVVTISDGAAVALGFVDPHVRPAMAALLTLDARLGEIVRSTSEPVIGQMRLAWWREALSRLDAAPAPAEPVLQAVQADLLSKGITGTQLAAMTEAWEELIVASPLDADALGRYARGRGGVLFGAAQMLLGGRYAMVDIAGEGWALADLALHARSAEIRSHAIGRATPLLARAFAEQWPRLLRPLGILALLARFDLEIGRSRVGQFVGLTKFRMTGR